VGGTWQLDYILTNGLNLDTPYSTTDPGYIAGNNALNNNEAYDPATDGLRNIAGQTNPDGSVTIYAVTSTVSGSGDQGADPNKLVEITDDVAATSLPTSEAFTVLESADPGQVIRGVSLAPVPEPGLMSLLAAGSLAGAGYLVRRRRK
jgi:hypothetical protein